MRELTAAPVEPNCAAPWRVLAVLCIGAFAILMDTTTVNVAVPSLVDGLHAGLDDVLWVYNAYLLLFGALLVLMSRLGDIYGQRRLFVLGLVVFALSSAVCGAAQAPGELIAARAVQGLGAAMLAPQPLVIISATLPPERRGAALGVYNSMIALAAVIGPTLGGVLVSYVGWRWIFYVNLPVTACGTALAVRVLPDLRLGRRHRLDVTGVVLATLGLAALVFGLVEGQRYSWGKVTGAPVTVPEVMTAGAVLLAAFCLWQRSRRNREPLLPGTLFADRTVMLLCALPGCAQFALASIMVLGAVNLQSVLGYSAVVSGLTSLPLTVGIATLAPLAGRLSDRTGSKPVLICGFTLCALGILAVIAVLSVHATPFSFIWPYILVGLGTGCLFAPLTTEALRRVPQELTGALAGVLNTSRQFGSAIGSAVVGGVLAAILASEMRTKAVAVAGQLRGRARASFLHGFAHLDQTGLEVGRGQSGGATVPATVPQPLRDRLEQVVHTIFTTSYVHAMRVALVIPAVLLVACAVSCLVLARPRRATFAPAEVL